MKDDGGGAFPVVVTDWRKDSDTASMRHNTYSTGGMSLRDYFAAAALQTLTPKWSPDTTTIPSGLALYAYEIADAMLAEREKP